MIEYTEFLKKCQINLLIFFSFPHIMVLSLNSRSIQEKGAIFLDKELKSLIRIGVIAAIVCLVVKYFPSITGWFGAIFHAAAPLIMGCIIAYVINLLMRKLESVYFPKSEKRIVTMSRRPVCIMLSLIILLCIIAIVITIVLPELISSFRLIGREIPVVIEDMRLFLLEYSDELPSVQSALTKLKPSDWTDLAKKAANFLTSGAGGLLNYVFSVVGSAIGTTVNFLIGFIFAIYLLYNKEKLSRQFQKLMRAWIPPHIFRRIMLYLHTAHDTFSSFIVGQCTEAVILGSLCTIGMLLFRFPYAAMTGTVVGVTALIPIVGAYIGAAVGAFMILTINPLQAVFFLLFLVILQQLEGNLIYPKVVGTSIGLPGMWVLAAITIGGSILGVSGMLLGVPTAATVYKLLGVSVNQRLKKQQSQGRRHHKRSPKQGTQDKPSADKQAPENNS